MGKSNNPDAAPARFEVDGNRLTLLIEGRDRLAALLALIDEAQASLRLLYYTFADDDAGRAVRAALERAAGRGVAVSLVVDGFGSALPDTFFAALEGHGADVCRFLPHYGRRFLLRNHQKMAVADEARALVGGFNVEDAYFDDANGWRDLGLHVDGPAAARLARYFDALAGWTRSKPARLRALRRTLKRFSEKEGRARWLMGGPTRRLSPWALALGADLREARHVDLIAAYFAPVRRMMRGLERVVGRGGAVRVVTAAKSDNTATIAAARHTYHRLLKRGVKVFEYQPLRLHTKLYVIDDVVHIGSANFDVRSLFLNLEVMLRIESRPFAAAMRAYVNGEVARSQAIDPSVHEQAGWFDRLRWSAAYYLVAVLDGRITRKLSFDVDRG